MLLFWVLNLSPVPTPTPGAPPELKVATEANADLQTNWVYLQSYFSTNTLSPL